MNAWPRGVLLTFLETLDATEVTPCLRTESEREWLETDLWELQYRLDHVDYHLERLIGLLQLQDEHDDADKAADSADTLCGGSLSARLASRMTTVVWDSTLGFETSAMFAAVRSALDVLARIAASFLKGYVRTGCSIKDLGAKLADYEGETALFQIIRDNWTGWIRNARDFRDELIHYSVLRTKRRKEIIEFERGVLQDDGVLTVETQRTLIQPPVVVRKRPKREKITRQHAFFYDEFHQDEGYIIVESRASIQLEDGKDVAISQEKLFEVDTTTHVDLGELCVNTRSNLQEFTQLLIRACQEQLVSSPLVVPKRPGTTTAN